MRFRCRRGLDRCFCACQVTILALELSSATMPAGKSLIMNVQDKAYLDTLKGNPVTIKEGIEYKCVLLFLTCRFANAICFRTNPAQ